MTDSQLTRAARHLDASGAAWGRIPLEDAAIAALLTAVEAEHRLGAAACGLMNATVRMDGTTTPWRCSNAVHVAAVRLAEVILGEPT